MNQASNPTKTAEQVATEQRATWAGMPDTFDTHNPTTIEAHSIPTLPTDAPQCWRDVHSILEADSRRLVLYGPPGTGKTFAGLNIGKHRESIRLICTEDMTDGDVVGRFLPNENGGMTWHEGALIRAWRTGARVVIDEIDKANGDVLSTLLAMTDTVASSRWEHPTTGEIVTPHPEFSVVMTTNLERMIDLPDALRDRFPVQIRINEPHPLALEQLPEVWREIARTSADLDVESRASIRAFLEVVRLEVAIGRLDAVRLVFGGNPSNAQRILQAVSLATLALENPSNEAESITLEDMTNALEVNA